MNQTQIIRGKAPLRIGLAGGGTDVSPYADLYGGAILNATVNLFARTTIIPHDKGVINIVSKDLGEVLAYKSAEVLPIDGQLDLIKGVYNRIVRDYAKRPLSFDLITEVDVPKGSGMGSSSTITVSLLGAFQEWLNLPFGEYDIAKLAFEIERKDLNMAGGRQDQYAATFGGFNFMEFYADEKVLVNPLRVKEEYMEELEMSLLLYYTGTSRESATIIKRQSDNFSHKADRSIEAAHKLKKQAQEMKEALLTGKLDQLGEILDNGWQAKKQMASGISNPEIDEMYAAAKKAGMSGGKISGAGGGGFMMMYCPQNSRYEVMEALSTFNGRFLPFQFSRKGLRSWKIN
ncbi:UNVERIFIED_CONTAM: hypothetical protein GTU68_058526 [Idotea baltica]|nr:hypothetical protein [Idotea baltica]